jgi:lysophospholipase L1-like esterase
MINRLIALLSLLVFISCTSPKTPTEAQEFRFLALGDSYTIGESVAENERWPVQLSDSLNSHGFDVIATDIIATTGWTTAELMNGITAENPDSNYNLVSLLIGVNNQFRGYDFEIYEEEFVELVNRAITFAGGDVNRVFMVSIPNYGVTPFGQSRGEDRIRQELLEYDAYANQIADQYGIQFFNITPISEKAKEDESYIANDRLHPSGKMYTEWVELMLGDVKILLEGQ